MKTWNQDVTSQYNLIAYIHVINSNQFITYIAQITCAYDQISFTYKSILTNKKPLKVKITWLKIDKISIGPNKKLVLKNVLSNV